MISIAIFTYKRLNKLNRCITSINHFDCKEILVFNDDEENALGIEQLSVKPELKKQIKIFNPKDFNLIGREFRKPLYMNKAVELSCTNKILFSDDDGVFDSNSVMIHDKQLNNYKFCAGSIKRNKLIKNHISHNILQGTNLSFNKKFYKDLNGYDEEYIKTGGGGDVDFWYRIYCKVLESNISLAYLVNASQRVRGKSTRKKDRVKARLYTMQKHNITNKSKMYKWFPEIRQKNNWMQLVNG